MVTRSWKYPLRAGGKHCEQNSLDGPCNSGSAGFSSADGDSTGVFHAVDDVFAPQCAAVTE